MWQDSAGGPSPFNTRVSPLSTSLAPITHRGIRGVVVNHAAWVAPNVHDVLALLAVRAELATQLQPAKHSDESDSMCGWARQGREGRER